MTAIPDTSKYRAHRDSNIVAYRLIVTQTGRGKESWQKSEVLTKLLKIYYMYHSYRHLESPIFVVAGALIASHPEKSASEP